MRAIDNPTLPRLMHPVAWWMWAIGLVASVSRTLNPYLTVSVLVAALGVSWARRARGTTSVLPLFLVLGGTGLAIRLAAAVLVGGGSGVTVLATLPRIDLDGLVPGPGSLGIGGPVTAESVLVATYHGLQLIAILACVGAANDLAPPSRLLKYLPASLYEIGTAVIVGVSFAPHLARYARDARVARRLRGHDEWGLSGVVALIAPVLAAALDRSMELAASMESRGFGRVRSASQASQRLRTALSLGGLVAVVGGTYGLLGVGVAPGVAAVLVTAGVGATMLALFLGDRSPRTRYRPDPWAAPEWLVSLGGAAAAGLALWAAAANDPTLSVITSPATWPALPLTALTGLGVAVAAAAATPNPPAPPGTAARVKTTGVPA